MAREGTRGHPEDKDSPQMSLFGEESNGPGMIAPGPADRELLESVVLSTLGRATLRTMQERNALTEDEAIALGVRAVREARQAGVSRLRAP